MELTNKERYDIAQKTYECEPTLTDKQVIEFCRQGFLMLEGVVPEEINRRTLEHLETNTYYEPTEILKEDWFVENVILSPHAAGAVRSLLGTNFGLPILMSQHRGSCPSSPQRWHRDGKSKCGPELNYMQVFYYPQNTPPELGPTEMLPGSHLNDWPARYMGHYGGIRGGVKTAAPAGSIFITVYSIWHRRAASTASEVRHMLKYNYWRTVPPARDWICEPDFDFQAASYGPIESVRMFYWLCGKVDEFRWIGGQGWPSGNRDCNYKPYGFPSGPARW